MWPGALLFKRFQIQAIQNSTILLWAKKAHACTQKIWKYIDKKECFKIHMKADQTRAYSCVHAHTHTASISVTVVHTGMHLHTECKVKHWSTDRHTRTRIRQIDGSVLIMIRNTVFRGPFGRLAMDTCILYCTQILQAVCQWHTSSSSLLWQRITFTICKKHYKKPTNTHNTKRWTKPLNNS